MALGKSIRDAIGTVWRAALSAVGAGQSAADVIASAAQQLPPDVPVSALPDLTASQQIATMAGSWAAARDEFGAAADDDIITGAMVTMAPWSMDLNAFNTLPSYHVVIGINVEGLEQPVYRTVTGITDLPATVGEMRSAQYVNALAMGVGTTPGGGLGGTVTGIDSVTITVGPAQG